MYDVSGWQTTLQQPTNEGSSKEGLWWWWQWWQQWQQQQQAMWGPKWAQNF
jgi:hypothetical protein